MTSFRIPILTEAELARYAHKIVGGLDEMHKAGFIHNNIRPDAIVLHKSRHGKQHEFSVRLGGFGHISQLKSQGLVFYDSSWLSNPDALLNAPEVLESLCAQRS